jgi:hypothetical protein
MGAQDNFEMMRVIILIAVLLLLPSCSVQLGELIPQWAGGLPKDAPPRPGTPEYDEFQKKQEAERVRDKRDDPPRPNTAPALKRTGL